MDEPAPLPRPRTATDRSRPAHVVIGGAAHLLATVPHLIGYRPERSLVLVVTGPAGGRRGGPRGRGEVVLTLRVDLPAPADARVLAASLTGALRAAAHDVRPPRTLVLHPMLFDASDAQAEALVPALRRLVRREGHRLDDVVLERAGAWTVVGAGPRSWEPVPDPADVPAVAELVLRGRGVASGREEVAARVRRRDERAAAATDLALTLLVRGRVSPDPVAALRELGAWVTHGEGEQPGPSARARIALVLSDRAVRDTVLARWLPRLFALEELVPAPEASAVRAALPPWPAGEPAALDRLLWLAARTPGPDAVPLLTLAGAVAWSTGEGTVANEAVDLALELDPGCRMAGLLRAALDAGAPPRGPRPEVA